MSSESTKTFDWTPADIFEGKGGSYALLVLNSGISETDKLVQLWNKAKFTVLVDGGATRWYQVTQREETYGKIKNLLPDLITGDLDSIDKDVLNYYKNEVKIPVTSTIDQNYTDFTKALFVLSESEKNPDSVEFPDKLDAILAYVECSAASGRPDQTFANYETLFHAINLGPALPPVYLISPRSLEWILPRGQHSIEVPKEATKNQKIHCGLVPLVECRHVTTSGFRWNVTDETLSFGKLVSTSNEFAADADFAEVNNPENPLLFTLQMKPEV